MPSLPRALCGLTAAAFGIALAGCSTDETANKVAAMNTSNIQRISNLYAGFQNMKSSSGPKDEAELKTFIKEYDPNKLQMMGVNANDLDKLFTSERDGKPFKVKYGVGGGRGSVSPVVFETVGQDGKKQVGFTGGTVEDVDDARYQELWSGKAPPTTMPGSKDYGRPTGRPSGAPTGPPGK